jgi:transmembrane sensor
MRDFEGALSDATRDLGASMPDDVARRLRARVQRGPARRRVRWERVGVLVGVLAVVGAAMLRGSEPRLLGGFTVAQVSADFSARVQTAWVSVSAGQGVLRDESLDCTMELVAPARLRRLSDGVELAAGTLTLDVNHDRPRASPFRVRVSHGDLEVLGTRFTVTQRHDGGEVTLHRGSIRFRDAAGQTRVLSPGQRLSWPLPAELRAERPVVAPAPQPKRAREKTAPKPLEAPAKFDAEALLERIAVLRSRGQYEEAVTALASALQTRADERLSFELGAILTRQLRDATRACEHWSAHRARFERGRYEREISLARAELRCASFGGGNLGR